MPLTQLQHSVERPRIAWPLVEAEAASGFHSKLQVSASYDTEGELSFPKRKNIKAFTHFVDMKTTTMHGFSLTQWDHFEYFKTF